MFTQSALAKILSEFKFRNPSSDRCPVVFSTQYETYVIFDDAGGKVEFTKEQFENILNKKDDGVVKVYQTGHDSLNIIDESGGMIELTKREFQILLQKGRNLII